MIDPITIYAIIREDLNAVYVGASGAMPGRIRKHRSINRHGLFSDRDPYVQYLEVVEAVDAKIREDAWMDDFKSRGWDVRSKKTGGVLVGRVSGKVGGLTGALGANAMHEKWKSDPQLAEERLAWCVRGGATGGETASKQQNAGWRQVWSCDECGYTASPPVVGQHQKRTNHVGRTQQAYDTPLVRVPELDATPIVYPKYRCGGCEKMTTAGALSTHQRATGHTGRTRLA